MQKFGILFVCCLYNHIVYAGIWQLLISCKYNHIVYMGIWWFVGRLLIQPYCIHGNLAIWLYAAYTTTVYTRVFGVQFVSLHIQLHCISRHMFRILKVVMFFIPKAHMFFFPKDDMFFLEDVCPKWKVNWATYTVIMYMRVCYVFIPKSGYVFLRILYVFLKSLICFFRKFYMVFSESVPCFFQKVLYVFFPESLVCFFGKF